jgi:hypothetical protein
VGSASERWQNKLTSRFRYRTERPAKPDHLIPPRNCTITAISPSGNKVGLFSISEFKIFDTLGRNSSSGDSWASLCCVGTFNKFEYHHGVTEPTVLQKHHFERIKFKCAAISDEFVAVESSEHVFIFDLLEPNHGKALFMIPVGRGLTHLLFSANGTLLLALLGQKALIMETDWFRLHAPTAVENTNNEIPTTEKRFREIGDWTGRQVLPQHVAFSKNGEQIIISTNEYSSGYCEIWILRLTQTLKWRKGQYYISLGPTKVTGIQLYVSPNFFTDG